MTLNQLLIINISFYIVSNMNTRYARISPISDIQYEKLSSDTIPISDIWNLDSKARKPTQNIT